MGREREALEALDDLRRAEAEVDAMVDEIAIRLGVTPDEALAMPISEVMDRLFR